MYAVLVHAGSSAQCGHYYCFVKSASGNFVLIFHSMLVCYVAAKIEAGNLDQISVVIELKFSFKKILSVIFTGSWHCMNDTSVNTVSLQRVLNSEAYLLFYIRHEVRQSHSDKGMLNLRKPRNRPLRTAPMFLGTQWF